MKQRVRFTLPTILTCTIVLTCACVRAQMSQSPLGLPDGGFTVAAAPETPPRPEFGIAAEPLGGLPTAADNSPESDVRFLWDSEEESKIWTTATAQALESEGQELLDTDPADARVFCPNFENLSRVERKQFWVQLISAIASKESNFDAGDVYLEKFKDSKGRRVRSRGLLQISRESGNLYGCQFAKEEELNDASHNLACGVKILAHWVPHDNRIAGRARGHFLGGSRYWSVLRKKSKLTEIRKATRSLNACRSTGK